MTTPPALSPLLGEPITFPDAEQVICDWLSAALAEREIDVPISTRVPNPRPASFVVVLRTGGARDSRFTDAAQITIDCWAAKESTAALLAGTVRELINAAPGRVLAAACVRVTEAGGPINMPDPTTAVPRYSQTFVVVLRGVAAAPVSAH